MVRLSLVIWLSVLISVQSATAQDPPPMDQLTVASGLPVGRSDISLSYFGSDLWSGLKTVAGKGDFAYCGMQYGLSTVSFADPSSPFVTSQTETFGGPCWDIAISGTTLVAASRQPGLRIFSLADPSNPVLLSTFDMDDAAGVCMDGSIAYVSNGFYGLRVLDLSNPASPVQIGQMPLTGFGADIVKADSVIFVLSNYDDIIQSIDVSDPAAPELISTYSLPVAEPQSGMGVLDSLLFVVNESGNLAVINISDPANLTLVDELDYSKPILAVFVELDRGFLYLSLGNSLLTIPAVLPLDSQFQIESNAPSIMTSIDGERMFVREPFGVTARRLIDPFYPMFEGGFANNGQILRSWIEGSIGYVLDDVNGLRILDLSDLSNPVELSNYRLFLLNPRDLIVRDNLALIPSQTYGLRIIDVSDPAVPEAQGAASLPGTVLSIELSGNLVASACGSSGVTLVNISNPSQPQVLGSYNTPGSALNTAFLGSTLYVADNDSGLLVLDIANPNLPRRISSFSFSRRILDIGIKGNWLFAGSETDSGLLVFDITTPTQPLLVASVAVSDWSRSIEIVSEMLVIAHNTSGTIDIEVFDIHNPLSPTRVAQYQTEGKARHTFSTAEHMFVADESALLMLNFDSTLPTPDLIPESISSPLQVLAGSSLTLTYVIRNAGDLDAGGGWTDRILLSSDTQIGSDIPFYARDLVTTLAAGNEYSVTETVPISKDLEGSFYLLLVTDALEQVDEIGHEQNNVLVSTLPIAILPYPYPDLVVDSIEVPPTAQAGREFNLRWFVRNQGLGGTNAGSWNDRIYLSPIPTFDPFVALFVKDVANFSALDSGEAYVNATSFTLPQDHVGDYYIFVESDFNKRVEEKNEGNNRTISDAVGIQIPPLPDMQMDSLFGPTTAIPGQEITINWVDHNRGDANAERTWVDAFYLSLDQNLDAADRLILSRSKGLNQIPGGLDDDFPTSMDVGGRYPGQFTFKLPQGLYGHYYLMGVIDQSDVIFEFTGESNNTTVGNQIDMTLIGPPDLVVSSIDSDPAAYSGKKMSVTWTVRNTGLGSTIDDQTIWDDRVYLSPDSTLDLSSPNTKALGTFAGGFGQFDPGEEYTLTKNVTIPNGLQGTFYVFVTTDVYNEEWENGVDTNNTTRRLEPIEVFLSPWPDLQVTSISTVDAAIAGEKINVSYTVSNMGQAEVDSVARQDRIYISQSENYTSAAQLLASLSVDSLMQPVHSYTRSAQVTIPAGYEGTIYLFVATDEMNAVYEHTDENNNRMRSQPILVGTYPYCDLVVTSATAPANSLSGEMITVQWQVTNQSGEATLGSQWSDGVILSIDDVPGNADDKLLSPFKHSGILGQGQSYSRTQSVRLPYGDSGRRYLFVRADYYENTRETNEGNNHSAPIAMDLTPAPIPDLEISDLSVRGRLYAGQRLKLGWRVSNIGLGNAQQQSWFDAIYLSPDEIISPSDLRLGVREHKGGLMVGIEYIDSAFVDIPNYLTGQYYLLVKSDNLDKVYEGAGESNNSVSESIQLSFAPLSDLIVTDIVVPDSATPGEDITVSWTLRNIGVNPAQGFIREAVYVSEDTVWQLEDPAVGVRDIEISLAPGEARRLMAQVSLGSTYQLNEQGEIENELPGILPGNYHFVVRSDLKANIREINDHNNEASSLSSCTIQIAELNMGEDRTFQSSGDKPYYFRLPVPNATSFRIEVVTNQPSAVNHLFVSAETIPSPTSHQFTEYLQNVSNPIVFLSNSDSTNFYLMLRSDDPVLDQTIIVKAVADSFSIVDVVPRFIGYPGQVSLDIYGSHFDDVRQAYLVAGHDTVAATSSIARNSGNWIEPTFNLPGTLKPGTLHIVLKRTTIGFNPEFFDGDTLDTTKVPIIEHIAFNRFAEPITLSRQDLPYADCFGVNVSSLPYVRAEGFPLTVHVTNISSTDQQVPLVSILFDLDVNLTMDGIQRKNTRGFTFVAGSKERPASMLRSGETVSLSISVDPPDLAHAFISYSAQIVDPSQEGGPDYAQMVHNWQPTISAGDPNLIVARLVTEFGTSWDSYINGLRDQWLLNTRNGITTRDVSSLLRQSILDASLRSVSFAAQRLVDVDKSTVLSDQSSEHGYDDCPMIQYPCWNPLDLTYLPCLALKRGESAVIAGSLVALTLYYEAGPEAREIFNLSVFPLGPNPPEREIFLVDESNHADLASEAKYFEGQASKTPSQANADLLANAIIPAITKFVSDNEDCEGMYTEADPWVREIHATRFKQNSLDFVKWENNALWAVFHGMESVGYLINSISLKKLDNELQCENSGKVSVAATVSVTYDWSDVYNFKPYLADEGPVNLFWLHYRLQEACWLTDVNSFLRLEYTSDVPPIEIEVDPNCRRQCGDECEDELQCQVPGSCGGDGGSSEIITANDPNDVVGPIGYGENRWLKSNKPMFYSIRFENDSLKATAPAQVVEVTQKLDSDLDWRSFRLGSFNFAGSTFDVPENTALYSKRLDVRDKLGVYVDVTAGIKLGTGEAFWNFRSIDPLTGTTPTDPMAGLLPVNNAAGDGNGFVSYTIKPKATVQSGDVINAQASIVFDINEPIATPEIFNTIDASAPTSQINALPAMSTSKQLSLQWLAEDPAPGSGIRDFALYMSVNDSAYQLIASGIETQSFMFEGEIGSNYKFYTVAYDNVGNVEAAPSEPDATTTITGVIACGDFDASGDVMITDIVYLINYLFVHGPLPLDPTHGNVNCDTRVNLGDAVYLVNYLYADGPVPCAACSR